MHIAAVLDEWWAGAKPREICHKHGISRSTLHRWARFYAGSEKRYKKPKNVAESHRLALSESQPARSKLIFCARQLLDIAFPSLPQTMPNAISREQINNYIVLYSFAALAHFREFLQAFLALLDLNTNRPAMVLACSLIEVAAQSYRVKNRIARLLANDDVPAAGRTMEQLLTVGGPLTRWKTIVGGFSRNSKKNWFSGYRYVTRLAHPEASTLASYWRVDHQYAQFSFPTWQTGALRPNVDSVLSTTVMFCDRIRALLILAGEKHISERLAKMLVGLA